MEFRLFYRGPLHAATQGNARTKEKHDIRRVVHKQLATLWAQRPLDGLLLSLTSPAMDTYAVMPVGPYQFVPLVSSKIHLVCRLDILLLRPGEPGRLVQHGGDLDNRIKTLFDALRVPKAGELPPGDAGPQQGEQPHFYCLLEDDARITSFSVESDRLLDPSSPDEVVLVVHVETKPTQPMWKTLGI